MDPDERQGWWRGGGEGDGDDEHGVSPPTATAAAGRARVAPAPLPELLRPLPPPAPRTAAAPPRSSSSSSSSRALAALQRAPSDPPFEDCLARRGHVGAISSSNGSNSSSSDPTRPPARPAPRALPASSSSPVAAATPKKTQTTTNPQWPRWRARLLGLLDSPWATSVLLALTLFAILQEDCKYAFLPADADVYIEAATAAAVAVLLAEIALSSLVRPRFFLSFYFWLDTLATLSLGFEIPALRAALGIGPSGGSGLETDAWVGAALSSAASSSSSSSSLSAEQQQQQPQQLPGFVDLGAAAPTAGLRAAGEQALVWAKAGRAVKVLRLVRALQQQRAWRQQRAARRAAALAAAASGGGRGGSAANKNNQEEQQQEEEWYTDVVERYRYAEARVGHRLQELTVRRLAVGLLATVAALALLDAAGRGGPAFGAPAPAPGYAGLRMLHAQAGAAVEAALEREFGAGVVGGGLAESEEAEAATAAATTARAVAAAAATEATSTPGFKAALAALSQTVEYNIGGRRGAFRPLLLVVGNVTLVPWEGGVGGGANGSANGSTTTPTSRRRRYLEVEGAVLRTQVCPSSLSSSSLSPPDPTSCAVLVSATMLDARAALAARSGAGVARTLLLAALLAAGSYLVQRDTRELVLAPVERMVARVRAMSDDPLGAFAAKWGDGGGGGGGSPTAAASEPPPPRRRPPPPLLLLRRLLRLPPSPSSSQQQQHQEDPPGQYETRLLEDAIQRVCALLAVSFGEAGAAIVADNLRRGGGGGGGGGNGSSSSSSSCSSSSTAGFDPMVPGRRVVAVFGFCDIRRFTDATEVLGEGVMEFVNAVAALAHGSAAARGGAPNKNVGDAFLLVWRLPRGLRPGDAGVVEEEESERAAGARAEGEERLGGGEGAAASAASAAAVGRELQGVAAALDAQRVASRALYAVRPSSSPSPSAALGARAPGASGGGAASRSPSPSLLLAAAAAAAPPSPWPLRRSLLAAAAAATVAAAAASSRLSFTKPIGADAGARRRSPSPSAIVDAAAAPASSAAPTDLLPPAALEAARRSVLACQDVRRLPLSPPAKAALVRSVADGALAAFCLTRVAMAASARLRRYGERADLCERMSGAGGNGGNGGNGENGNGAAQPQQPPPPYRVQMGFGLHVGWAIEGAIGSRHKVDASYLSPHVNLASRLEAATKQFGVPLLASRAFWACLSPAVRRKARLLDRVVVKGSAVPLEVYTYDLDVGAALEACGRGSRRAGGKDDDNAKNDDRAALALLERQPGDEWAEHPALARSWRLTEAWKARFDAGVSAYLAGDWPAARAALEGCRVLPPRRGGLREDEGEEQQEEEEEQDGPTAVLLEVMAAHGFVAPAGWRGYRELTEK